MANMEHVQLARRGRDVVARWREQNPNEILDLNAAYMSYARMPQVNLSGADLRNSDLMGAVLQRANLSGCHMNPCHMYHANLRQADLTRSRLNGANLRGADLRQADLSGADLDRAVLSDANLSGAKLSGANLSRANLTGANLSGANLSGAGLVGAQLVRADLSEAELQSADCYQAQFWGAGFADARLAGCLLGYTVFQDCDLSVAAGLEEIRHDAPSSLGLDTFYRSGGGLPAEFLRGAGLPASALAMQELVAGGAPSLDECYISCRDEDEPLARQLAADLQRRGLRCWVFSEQVRGSALVNRHSTSDQEEVERWVRRYDKLIVLASARALDTEAILNDITAAKEKQQSSDSWTLFLAAPDAAVVNPTARTARSLAAEHIVFDLRDYAADPSAAEPEVARLAEALGQQQPAAAGAPAVNFQL